MQVACSFYTGFAHQYWGSGVQYLQHPRKKAYRPETMISYSEMCASLRSVALLALVSYGQRWLPVSIMGCEDTAV